MKAILQNNPIESVNLFSSIIALRMVIRYSEAEIGKENSN